MGCDDYPERSESSRERVVRLLPQVWEDLDKEELLRLVTVELLRSHDIYPWATQRFLEEAIDAKGLK